MGTAATAAAVSTRPGKPRARVGRPPRVTVQAIVATALELGLEKVTLKQIADELGVAQATLYRHVNNRDELVRLAAFQLTLSRRMPGVADAHWSDLAIRYAESLFDSFVGEPLLIAQLLKGELGPHAEVDVLEQFLGAITQHGFSEIEGVQLFHAIGMITIGAAAGSIGLHASTAAGQPWRNAMQNTLAERDVAELPRVRRVLPATLDADPIPWLPALRALLSGIAAARGESLPAPVAEKISHPTRLKSRAAG
ncbi:MAG TPA: TetR family transcriptional regulator [Stenotrophobium sp.]|nr:TetR family transcriptional regulator [Stenotrophobium sp.]